MMKRALLIAAALLIPSALYASPGVFVSRSTTCSDVPSPVAFNTYCLPASGTNAQKLLFWNGSAWAVAAAVIGPTGTQGQPGGGITIPYVFSTATADADPGNGNLRLNNATQNISTAIRADLLDPSLTSWTSVLDTLDASTSTIKGQIRLSKATDPTKWLMFDLTARASPSGYRNFTVTNTGSSAASPFSDGDVILFAFTRTGDKGATGATGAMGTAPICIDNTNQDTYACSVTPTLTSYTDGLCVVFQATFSNSGAATLNIDGLGDADILYANGNFLDSSHPSPVGFDIPALLCSDGVSFYLPFTPHPLTGSGATGSFAIWSDTFTLDYSPYFTVDSSSNIINLQTNPHISGVTGTYQLQLGFHTTMTGSDSISIGRGNDTSGSGITRIGAFGSAIANNSTAIGYQAGASSGATGGLAVGAFAVVEAARATALGYSVLAEGADSFVLGSYGAGGTAGTGPAAAHSGLILATSSTNGLSITGARSLSILVGNSDTIISANDTFSVDTGSAGKIQMRATGNSFAIFDLSAINTGSNRTFTFPNTTGNIALVEGPTFGSASAAIRVRSSLGTPSSLANGDWWVECSGTSPTRTCSILARDTGATRTIAASANF